MHVRGWIKDVMYGLIIFGICASLILVVSVAADNIVAKHNAVIVSKNVNSNLDCDDSICTSVDNVSGSENDENVNLACDGREQYNNNNNIKDKKIVCWGDSITYGLGGQENTYIKSEAGIIDASNWNYPDTLRYYTGMDVYNLGVCGETSYEIALRHGINDVDTSTLMALQKGTLYHTEIIGITKGSNGSPGELTGFIEYDDRNILGTITENTTRGIFGVCSPDIAGEEQEALPVGLKQEIEAGPAQIRCSIGGDIENYEVEITDINLGNDNINRGIVLQITDERLLSETGGIVQGMSGSPIIQNGKIIGAVTHVLVQDSTKGYGIFIERMLEKN